MVTPPPLMTRHRATAPPPAGTTTAMVMIGFGGGFWADDGIGVEVRGSHQVSESVEVGLGIGFAKNVAGRDPDSQAPRLEWLLAARGFATFYPPNLDWTCATVGLGAGIGSTRLGYWTVDGVVSLGHTFAGVAPHLDFAVAMSTPWATGGTFSGEQDLPSRTFHFGGSFGITGNIDRHLVSGDFTLLRSHPRPPARAATLYWVSGAYGYGFAP